MRKYRRSGRAGRFGGIVAAILCLSPAWPAAAPLPPEIERLGEEGAGLLHNLEFDRARQLYEKLCRDYPGHPAGRVMLGTAAWWQAWQGLARPDDVLTQETDRILDQGIELARKLAIPERPDQPGREWDPCAGEFFLGGALGVKAHCALLRGNWLTAVKGGRESLQSLRKLSSCTGYADEACLGMGIYSYQAARLPWHLKWISRFLMGRYGTTEEALALLERAAARARWLKFDAQCTLVGFYLGEERAPERALPHARAMVREKPASPLARLLLARTLNRNGKFAEALTEARFTLDAAHDPGSPAARIAPAVRCEEGIALIGLGRLAEAEAGLVPATEARDGNLWAAEARLRRGNAFDLMGSRDLAVAEYRLVAQQPDRKPQAEAAKRRIKRPYTWADFEGEIHTR